MNKLLLVTSGLFITVLSFAQGTLTGNIESTFQYLNADSIIDAKQPAEKGLINSYMNVFYTQGNFKAGMRLESYLPRIQGYPNRFDGTGIGMRYIGYTNGFVDVTLGSFYEQFGTGLAFRAYEDRALGYDNMMDGARIIVRPTSGLVIKGVYGYQRLSFQGGNIIHGDGIVRGIDGEFHLNEGLKKMKDFPLDVVLGASFVSKYQEDNNPDLILPQNVGTYGGRMKLRYKNFYGDIEYVQKEQDPSSDNNYIYNYGHASVFNVSYTRKGLGILVSGKSVDNMSYRSDRTKDLQDVFVNYLPSLNKTHTYNLVATLYPYATQPLGEVAYQTDVLYTFKKGTKLGGKYGTTIGANFSTTYQPRHSLEGINPLDSTGVTYVCRPFQASDSMYWQDINFNITKKFNKKFSTILSFYSIKINNDVVKISNDASGINHSNIGVGEFSYKFNSKHSLRAEIQGLFVQKEAGEIKDKGNWATLLLEYSISPGWFFSFMNQYNYGNPEVEKRVNYPILTCGYGIEFCERIKADPKTQHIIICFLTARGEDYSQIAGLESGGDDYVTKPIKPKVLLSRINALLRRNFKTEQKVDLINFAIDRERYLILKNNVEIHFPRKEFELLALLASKPNAVFKREFILNSVWGSDIIVGDRTIDVHIRKIREKIGNQMISTVKGVGYKFNDNAEEI